MQMIEWLNSNQGAVMAVLTIVYVVATISIAMMAKGSNALARKNLETLTALERERVRPSVSMDILPDLPFLTVHVINHGQTTAYDIIIDINPKIVAVFGFENSTPKLQRIGFIENGIPSLPPGSTRSALIGNYTNIEKAYPKLEFHGTISYESRDKIRYEDTIIINMKQYSGCYNTSKASLSTVAKELEMIRRDFGHLVTGFKKMHIITQDIEQYREEEEKEHKEITNQLSILKENHTQEKE